MQAQRTTTTIKQTNNNNHTANINHTNSTLDSSIQDDSWRDWNYYQLLGLGDEKDTFTRYDQATIRKAYRNMAKRYHPDKALHGIDNNSTLKEAINARFAKLAEAYQVLSDDKERNEYDQYLLAVRRREQQQQRDDDSLYGWQHHPDDHMFVDPMELFQSVFMEAAAELFGKNYQHTFSSDPTLLYGDNFDNNNNKQHQNHHHHDHPINVRQEQLEYYDQSLQQSVLRVSQTEDFADGYYRVLMQEFVEEWDPYQRIFIYVPLQAEPVVVEEGSSRQQQQEQNNDYGNYFDHASDQQSGSVSSLQAWIRPDTWLTVGMSVHNPPFVASLTPSCTLVVYRLGVSEDYETDQLLWSSPNKAQYTRNDQDCAWGVVDSHVVITRISSPGNVLWKSQKSLMYRGQEDWLSDDSEYAGRLDDDGSLAVYRLEEADEMWSFLIDKTTALPPLQRLVAKVGGISLELGTDHVRTVCIFATSPFGCFRLGRLMHHMVRTVSRLMDRLFEVLTS